MSFIMTYEKCIEALKLGFTSIMYDCSTDSYEENIKKVKEMADIAHSYGATIEGELGHVGDNPDSAEENPSGGEKALDPSIYYTQLEQAKDYAKRTGVDALAIAVGNAHGAYKLPPKLDFERIDTIVNNCKNVGKGMTEMIPYEMEAVKAETIKKMELFGSVGRY